MHNISRISLKFTSRTSWMADLFKNNRRVATVPVAWRDQVIFDKVKKCPAEFLVWLRTHEKAADWMGQGESIIVIAESRNPNEQPRQFKSFLRFYKVQPIALSENPLAVRARYVDVVDGSYFEQSIKN